jgi:hypothetical protein
MKKASNHRDSVIDREFLDLRENWRKGHAKFASLFRLARGHGVADKEIADELCCSPIVIEDWAAGVAEPLPVVQEEVVEVLHDLQHRHAMRA